ncbi:hypothetical protein [Streptomyces sp. NPDC059262]|uniref:hypothetical protein n=1 Tax=Streptomyces sp. NPDC059262 TaxID=3346797 RepID=UPI0036A66713
MATGRAGGRRRAGRAGEDDPACLVCRGFLKSAAVMFGERLDAVVPGESVPAAKACRVFFAVASARHGTHGPRGLAGLTADNRARLVTGEAEPTP